MIEAQQPMPQGSTNTVISAPGVLYVDIQLDPGATMPAYASDQAAGMDLYACLKEPVILMPGKHQLIPTGVRMAVPAGYEAQVRSRSGMALNHGVVVFNSPGTIDADYRGAVGVILMNWGEKPFEVLPGMRIAQLVIAPVMHVQCRPVEALSVTVRQNGGFGSTGVY